MHVDPGARAVPFAHASEAELARILDYYGIAWEYEPRPFPILWNLEGAVAESFTPDFYLPELDLYVELTTLRQSLVRKKNRKLRRLRELYPDVNVKLFYARDFRALMLKYGRIGLVDSLTGSEGQSTPSRRDRDAEPAPAHEAIGDDARRSTGEDAGSPAAGDGGSSDVTPASGGAPASDGGDRGDAPAGASEPVAGAPGRRGSERRRHGGRRARLPEPSRA